jgi:hypothetical protein
MGGLILDDIIFFVWLTVARWVGRSRCKNWEVTKGAIVTAQVSLWINSCAVVKYTYELQGATYTGIYRRGFWISTDLAERVVARIGDLKSIAVRYNPASPSKSYLMEEDQTFPKP